MRRMARGLLLALTLVGGAARAEEKLRVLAAASLTDALGEVAQRFEAKEKGVKVTLVFGASNDLERQLRAGAPGDVFVSADEARMDALEKAGRVAKADRVTLLGNQLVVVVPKESGLRISAPRDLLGVKRLALGDPEAVPAGVYARRWLEGLGLWEALKPKVVPALDVRAALAAVETEAVDAGIVYRTDAAISKKVKVAHEVPVAMGPVVVYPVAVLKDAAPAGRRFLAFLQGAEARAIFERRGFRFLPQAK